MAVTVTCARRVARASWTYRSSPRRVAGESPDFPRRKMNWAALWVRRAGCRWSAPAEPAARGWGVSRFSAAEDELGRALGQARTLPMLAPRQVVIVSEIEAVEQLN